jgi:hypothetical protein
VNTLVGVLKTELLDPGVLAPIGEPEFGEGAPEEGAAEEGDPDVGLAELVLVGAALDEFEIGVDDADVVLSANTGEEVVVAVEVLVGVVAELSDEFVVDTVEDVVVEFGPIDEVVVLVVDITADEVVEFEHWPPGTLSVCPSTNKSQLRPGFAALRASKVTDKLVAIVWPLSPALTV